MKQEFVAWYEATIHELWLRNIILGLGVAGTITKPLKIYFDNTATYYSPLMRTSPKVLKIWN